jgi:hypothetical protein
MVLIFVERTSSDRSVNWKPIGAAIREESAFRLGIVLWHPIHVGKYFQWWSSRNPASWTEDCHHPDNP